MSDASKPAAKPESKPASESKSSEATSSSSSSPSSSSSSTGEGGKSARESVGGAKTGHYGFFSNVKTPEYKSGWDDIWGKKETSGGRKKAAPRSASKAAKGPVTVTLDVDDLPDDLRAALAAAAKKKLGRGKAAYDRSEKAGTLVWEIACTVQR